LVEHGFWGAHGENYPNKAVTLVVTAAPGGVTDILARALFALSGHP
jgi:tripartite-type tricarboxylate transporter receptor subunit TctC